jgi:hypothetical protein
VLPTPQARLPHRYPAPPQACSKNEWFKSTTMAYYMLVGALVGCGQNTPTQVDTTSARQAHSITHPAAYASLLLNGPTPAGACANEPGQCNSWLPGCQRPAARPYNSGSGTHACRHTASTGSTVNSGARGCRCGGMLRHSTPSATLQMQPAEQLRASPRTAPRVPVLPAGSPSPEGHPFSRCNEPCTLTLSPPDADTPCAPTLTCPCTISTTRARRTTHGMQAHLAIQEAAQHVATPYACIYATGGTGTQCE